MRSLVPVLAAFALGMAPAHGADCKLSQAIYGQPDGGAEIWFSPLGAGRGLHEANGFTLRIPDFAIPFKGSVAWTLDFDRPNATLTMACPEVPADDPAGGCVVWQGVVYAIHADGSVWLLPEQGEDPPPTILFSDLGRALYEANGTVGAFVTEEAVWDAFTLKGCAS